MLISRKARQEVAVAANSYTSKDPEFAHLTPCHAYAYDNLLPQIWEALKEVSHDVQILGKGYNPHALVSWGSFNPRHDGEKDFGVWKKMAHKKSEYILELASVCKNAGVFLERGFGEVMTSEGTDYRPSPVFNIMVPHEHKKKGAGYCRSGLQVVVATLSVVRGGEMKESYLLHVMEEEELVQFRQRVEEVFQALSRFRQQIEPILIPSL